MVFLGEVHSSWKPFIYTLDKYMMVLWKQGITGLAFMRSRAVGQAP
jgi:hypothetical protein